MPGGQRPFRNEFLRGSGDPKGKTLRDMKLLEGGGFPPPVGRLRYEPADEDRPRIYRLNEKPHCWRLYFNSDAKKQRLIYLRAVCKKKGKADAEDAKKARRRFNEIASGRASIEQLVIPDR